MTIYIVTIYPWDDTPDTTTWAFDTEQEARSFVDHLNSLYDGNMLSGGHDEVRYAEYATVTADQAIQEMVEWYGPSED